MTTPSENAYAFDKPKKKPWYKRPLPIIGLVLAGLILIGIISGGGDDNPTVTRNNTAGSPEAAAGQQGPARIGDTVDIKGLAITVSGLRPVPPPSEFLDPTVCVDIAVTNNGTRQVSMNPFDFKLTTPANVNVDSTPFGTEFTSVEVNPGGSHGGVVCFQAPGEPGEYKVIYEQLFSKSAEWVGAI